MARMKHATIPKQPANATWFDMNDVYDKRGSLSLRDYQIDHLGFSLAEKRSLNLSEAGTGKTPVGCLWVYHHTQEGRVIWTMPKSLLVKNYHELLLWSNLEPHQVIIIDGTPKQREKQFANRETKVFMMGFDSFANNYNEIIKRYPDTYHLCGDEWHLGFSTHGEPKYNKPGEFNGPRRTHNMYQYMARGGDLLVLTGTYINGRLSSAYPGLKLINPLYYPTYNNFMLWHAMLDEYGNPFMWKNHDRLEMLIDRHSRRITYEDAYGKEKKSIHAEMCTMSPSQAKAFTEIKQRGITELDDDFLEAENEAVALQRCFKIMQSPDEYGLAQNESDGKDAHLIQHLETHKFTGEPLIIFEVVVTAHARYKKICERLGLKAEFINGSIVSRRGEIDHRFRNGEIDVLICSPEVAGVGFNWGHVDHIIFMSFDWQDTTFIQNYRRALRGVREKPVKITLLVYRGGLELHVAKKLLNKSNDRTQVENGVTVDLVTPIMQAA